MDVEMQMESKGLPTQFGTTSQQPEETHIADNVAATVSHSDTTVAPVSELKQSDATTAPFAASTVIPQDVAQPTEIPSTNGFPHDADVHMDQPISESREVVEEVTSLVPDSQPPLVLEPPVSVPAAEPPTIPASISSVEESEITSSIPAGLPSSAPTTDLSQSMMETESSPIPQPPVSDLRTSPHADNLTMAEVAEIEAEKHAEDNAADLATPVAAEPSAVTVTAASSSLVEPVKISETGLATPPMHSPPPAPQPSAATLPIDASATVETSIQPPVISQEEPVEPTPTPAEPVQVTQEPQEPQDQVMQDLPSPPAKVAREREEDEADVEPVAKRLKTDEEEHPAEATDFKVPDMPPAGSPGQTNGTSVPTSAVGDGDDSVTPPRLAHMKKIISNLKKSNASSSFRLPVDWRGLNIPTYPDVVKNPMDLSQIDNKLKNNQYSTVSEFTNDFELIVNNCVLFNGKDHAVTVQAFKMQSSFHNQMANLPKAGFAEPSKEEKRAARVKQEPTRTAPPRRPSVSTVPSQPTGTARSPKAATPSGAFAPGPDGVPLIRRDSAMDGRPKRAIVAPKRHQELAGGRPKKKKYELQLRFCQEVLKEIASTKHWQLNQYFTHPVDPVALNIPTYFQIVKKPMDLGTIQNNLDNNVYEKAKDFEEDVRLVFKNCYKFNPEGDYVNQLGHQLEDMFDKKWATKDDWIAAREPASEPQSDEEEEEEQEESEEDADDSEDERNDKIAALQKQIEMMSKQMGELTNKKPKKKSKSPTEQPKKSKSKSGKKDKSKATFPNLQKAEKKKSSKPKAEKERYVTFAEKQYISNGIGMLPEKQMGEALKIIQQSVPSLGNSETGEVELDIEEVPNHALLKLLSFVKKYAGPPPDEPKVEVDTIATSTTSKSKKKGMSKSQQEAQIDQLKGKLDQYASGALSPNAIQSVETGDSSDDDENSDESEEE